MSTVGTASAQKVVPAASSVGAQLLSQCDSTANNALSTQHSKRLGILGVCSSEGRITSRLGPAAMLLSRCRRALVRSLSTLDRCVLPVALHHLDPGSSFGAHFSSAEAGVSASSSSGAHPPTSPWSAVPSRCSPWRLQHRSFASKTGDIQTWQDDLGRSLTLMAQGSPDAARELLQKGISSVQQHLATSTHPALAVMHNQAAVVYLIGSMLEDAESAARESLRIILCFSVPTSVEVAACQLRLATVLAAKQQVGEAKRLLGSATAILGGSPQHQDSYGEALFYTGLCSLHSASGYDAVRRVDDLMLEGLRKFGEKIDLQRPLIDVALREHGLLRARAEEREEWEAVEGMLQQALLLVKQVGVEMQLRGMLALQLGVVQLRHRGKEAAARETFAAALGALGDEVDESHDVIQQGLKRYEVLTEVLRRYGATPPPQ